MFGYNKKRNSWAKQAEDVYRVLLFRALEPVFYHKYKVPDSFEGRFDLLLLHVFIVMHLTLKHADARTEEFNQALFDVLFQDMDQTLREGGKGDMGVSKEMKRMMLAFNGRMNRYDAAYKEGQAAFAEAIHDNVYGGGDVDSEAVQGLAAYIAANIDSIEKAGTECLFSGTVQLSDIEE